MKTRKLVVGSFIILFLMVAFSCNNDQAVIGKRKLSDDELTKLVLSDVDFNLFMSAKINENKVVEKKIGALNSNDKIILKQLLQRFDSYDAFETQSTAAEKILISNIFYVDEKSNRYFQNLVSKLDRYDYNSLSLFELTKNCTRSPENAKTEASCDSVAISAYSSTVLYMISKGYSISDSRGAAERASNWAYWGCVMGQR
jgi:hypothetical protein